MLWNPTSPVTVPGNHTNAGSVKYVIAPDLTHNLASQSEKFLLRLVCHGPMTSPIAVPDNHSRFGSVKYVMGPDITHSRAGQPQKHGLREKISWASTDRSPVTVPANHSNDGAPKRVMQT